MSITFYGTGSSVPTPFSPSKPMRSYSGWNIEIGKNSLLFDIGGGVLHKMILDGKDLSKIPTHLFISHFHPDHCSDIIPLMQGRGLYERDKGNINPLFVGGPQGLNDFFHSVLGVKKWESFTDELKVFNLLDLHEVKEGLVISNNEFKVSCSPIKHFNGSCYKLEVGGKKIIYSGDMGYDENICKIGKNADIAILECSYPDRKSLKSAHLCPEDIGKLANLGNFKKVVLTHMYPECEGREDEMISTIKNLADTDVVVAYDLLRLKI